MVDGCSLELCLATLSVASSVIFHRNKSQFNCMTISCLEDSIANNNNTWQDISLLYVDDTPKEICGHENHSERNRTPTICFCGKPKSPSECSQKVEILKHSGDVNDAYYNVLLTGHLTSDLAGIPSIHPSKSDRIYDSNDDEAFWVLYLTWVSIVCACILIV